MQQSKVAVEKRSHGSSGAIRIAGGIPPRFDHLGSIFSTGILPVPLHF